MNSIRIVSLDFDPDNGCLTSICHSHGEISVKSWGCEFGDWYGFFSQAKLGGAKAKITNKQVSVSKQGATTLFDVALPTGRWRFAGKDCLCDGSIHRDYSLTALDDSRLGDFVIRAAFAVEDWPDATIGGKMLVHRRENRMFQLPVTTAELSNQLHRIVCTLESPNSLLPWDVLTYLRDEASNLWVMHHRLLTKNGSCDEYVFRVRHRAWSSDRCPMVGWGLTRRLFWRLTERCSWIRPTIQLGGNITLRRGECLNMTSSLQLEPIQ